MGLVFDLLVWLCGVMVMWEIEMGGVCCCILFVLVGILCICWGYLLW